MEGNRWTWGPQLQFAVAFSAQNWWMLKTELKHLLFQGTPLHDDDARSPTQRLYIEHKQVESSNIATGICILPLYKTRDPGYVPGVMV